MAQLYQQAAGDAYEKNLWNASEFPVASAFGRGSPGVERRFQPPRDASTTLL
jgi:hypothetical protein